MFGLGIPELLLILLVLILLFGAGRISKLASELGNGIRQFRHGMDENEGAPPADPTKSGK